MSDEMTAAEWDAAYLQLMGSIVTETGYQCREMTYHPTWYWVRCMRPPHDSTYPHMVMVNGVTDSWPDDEPSCVRHRNEREAAEQSRLSDDG